MKYRHDEYPPTLELSRRNLNVLLDKLNDPNSRATLGTPGTRDEPYMLVKAVEDAEHYSDRPPGEMYMPGGDPMTRLIEQLKDEQHKLCAYNTREGDGRPCNCDSSSWFKVGSPTAVRAEITGCCELRAAIQVLVQLQEKEEQNDQDG